MPQPSITEIIWKIKYLRFHSNFPGANEFMGLDWFLCYCQVNFLREIMPHASSYSQAVLHAIPWYIRPCYTPHFNEVEREVYWFHVVRLSFRLSVHLRTKPCLLCIFHNTSRIHLIFKHLVKQLQKVCPVSGLLQNSKLCSFGKFLEFVTLTLSFYDMGSDVNHWYG